METGPQGPESESQKDMSTTIPGLFTGGDCGGKFHYGANAGYHGMNFGWCTISGYHAAQSAIAWGRKNPPGRPSEKRSKKFSKICFSLSGEKGDESGRSNRHDPKEPDPLRHHYPKT